MDMTGGQRNTHRTRCPGFSPVSFELRISQILGGDAPANDTYSGPNDPRSPEACENHLMLQPTVVEQITEDLAYRIAAGLHQPGELLPSVRQLATELGASTASVNSALGRLASLGFADGRRGLGYVVRDIRLYGRIDTWRYVFRFARKVPELSARLFADMINIDHLLVVDALRTFSAATENYDSAVVLQAVDQMELLVNSSHASRTDIMTAELHVLRCVFASLDKPAALSVFNSVGEVLITVPEAAQAFYSPADPAAHLLFMRMVHTAKDNEVDISALDLSVVEAGLRDYHDGVIAAFRQHIRTPPQPTDHRADQRRNLPINNARTR